MGYEDKQNNIETEEGLSADEVKVRQMLGGLKRVETPKNFGFAVQARIARAKPEDYRAASGGWALLRYAMPLALVLLVVSGFVLNGIYNVNENSVPPVAGVNPPAQAAPPAAVYAPPAGDFVSTGNRAASDPGTQTPILSDDELLTSAPPVQRIRKSTVSSRNSGGGSIDSTQEGRTPIIDLNPTGPVAGAPPGPGKIGPTGQIPVQAILKIVGIRADASREGWKVTAVEANSLSDHSGVKTGDFVEAINGQPVTEGTRFSGGLIVKNLRVKRDGKSLDIDLK